jgi:hypothetical protein
MDMQNPLVKDWGISHTTLEEVYLRVTKKEYKAFSEIEQKKNSEQKGPEKKGPEKEINLVNDFN